MTLGQFCLLSPSTSNFIPPPRSVTYHQYSILVCHRRYITWANDGVLHNVTLGHVRVTAEQRVKGKSVPLQARSDPEGSRKLRFPDLTTTAQDGGKFVNLTHRLPLPPGNIPGTHFGWRLSRPQGHSAIGRILCQCKIPPTPAGFEPATSRFVAQHLNHCATAVLSKGVGIFNVKPGGTRSNHWTLVSFVLNGLGSNSDSVRLFPLFQNLPSGFLFSGYQGYLLGVEPRRVKLTTHLHLILICL